jgi:predicted nucleic-acid-binding Zn-ribbon protein
MKKSNKCPKCASTEIYADDSFSHRGASSKLGVSTWSQVSITTYACLNCGFTERYIQDSDINDPDKMDKIRSNWKKKG